VSDRKAVFVVAETAKSLGHNTDDLTLNRDSDCRHLTIMLKTSVCVTTVPG